VPLANVDETASLQVAYWTQAFFFVSDTNLDNQATRNTPELTQATAAFLDQIIAITDRLPPPAETLIVTDEVLSAAQFSATAIVFPDEVATNRSYREGSVAQVLVNRYERDPRARAACIDAHGSNCSICGMDFGTMYGPEAEGYIHVHHLRPLSEIAEEYEIDPVADLRPVCPNCHAILHRRMPSYSIEEVRGFLARQRSA
jgi:hypothetical protein